MKTRAAVLITVFLLSFNCISSQSYESVIGDLEQLTESTPELKSMIEEVLSEQSDTSFWSGFTVPDLIDYFGNWLTYNPLPENPGKYIEPFDELANSAKGELLFNDNVFSSWFIRFLDARGEYLGTNASASSIPLWINDTSIHIEDYVIPEGGFQCFNDFFLRNIKSGSRPLAGGTDPSVLVSPADGSIFRIFADDVETNFRVKRDVINIRQALNNNLYAERFIGGDVVDILLWFTDYHHFHSPVSGRIVFIGEYPGSYNYNFADVNWYKELARHKRVCYLIESDRFGIVAMIPVGFWGVGSIINERVVGERIEKGDEMGHFAYGGSSILLVFEPGSVKFIPEITEEYLPVKAMAQLGIATSE